MGNSKNIAGSVRGREDGIATGETAYFFGTEIAAVCFHPVFRGSSGRVHDFFLRTRVLCSAETSGSWE